MKIKKSNLILPITSIICVLLIWELSALIIDSKFVLPDIIATFGEMGGILSNGNFYISLLFTILRGIISFIISFVLALIIGIQSYKSKRVESFFNPIVAIIRAMPTIAIILLLLVWTNSFIAPIIVAFLVVFPTLLTNVKTAFNSIDKNLLEALKIYNVSKKEINKNVIIPYLKPSLYRAIGNGLSLNIKLMVAAEVLASTSKSIGNILNNYSYSVNLEIAKMICVVILIIAICLVIEFIFNKLSKRADYFN